MPLEGAGARAAVSTADRAAVGEGRNGPGVRHTGAAGAPAPPVPGPLPPLPPLIVPVLVSVAIVPAFDTPAPPLPAPKPEKDPPPPCPPLIAPRLVRVLIVPAFDTPAPPAPPGLLLPKPPFPPLIVAPFALVKRLTFDPDWLSPQSRRRRLDRRSRRRSLRCSKAS